MKFGTFLLLQSADKGPSSQVYANAVVQAELVDKLGFEAVWLAEHHFSSYGYMPTPLMMAVKLAERMERVNIGTAVLVLHHPLQLAEEIAMADQLTGGRLEVDFGSGYQEYEFQRLGVSLEEKRLLFDEGLEVIVKALTQESFTHEGEHYRFPETSIFPRPFQTPHPSFWIAAQRPSSIAATVRRGYKCITGGSSASAETIRGSWEVFRSAVDESGQGWSQEFAVQRQVYVSESGEDARAQVGNALHYRMVTALRSNTQRVEMGLAVEEPLAQEPDPKRCTTNGCSSAHPTCARPMSSACSIPPASPISTASSPSAAWSMRRCALHGALRQ